MTDRYDFTVSDVVPASPQAVYDAWLDAGGHSKMTGAPATASREVGGRFTAWDNYISGENLVLEPGRRIVQSWRTSAFTEDQESSEIEVLLESVEGGTRITLHHRNVPVDHTGYEDGGWQDNYFEPMKAYFAR